MGSKASEKEIRYHSIEESSKCIVEEKGKPFIEHKSSRRAAVEERIKSISSTVDSVVVSENLKSVSELNPDSFVGGKVQSSKTFMEHKVKSSRRSAIEEKAKLEQKP